MPDYSAYNPAVFTLASHRLEKDLHSENRSHECNGQTRQTTVGENAEPSPDNRESAPVLTKYDVGWRRIVRNFSPSWFTVTMGTGIVAILLGSIPFQARWLYYLSIVFFILNTMLFFLGFVISILRYTLYPEIWRVMIQDPVNSLFLGCIPMGFATLIRMWIIVCVPAWGTWAVTFAWILWMVDAIASVAVTTLLSFSLMSHGDSITLDRITATQILPIAATIIASGTGAAVTDVLPNDQHALGTLLTCYVMWGMSVPLALIIMTMYYQRLALHKLPSREVIVSCFLPLGPLGYGGYGILYLGSISIKLFDSTDTLPAARGIAGPILYVAGFMIAFLFWGFGLVWLILALGSIYKARPFPFNMGWWGFTFPLGVFAGSTIQIGEELPSMAFKVFGTIFSTIVILLWVVVAVGTAKGAWSGKLFFAPCLANLKVKEKRDEPDRSAGNSQGNDETVDEVAV